MAENRPRGRQKNVSGQGKGVYKRGSGLGSGPVGSSGGYGGRPGGGLGRPSSSSGNGSGGRGGRPMRSGGGSGGLMKIIMILIVLFLGGGTGLGSLLGGLSGGSGYEQYPQQQYQEPQYPQSQMQTVDLSSLFGTLGGGSISTGWDLESNSGKLDTTVVSGARDKYTKILGNGKDVVTLMVYLCGTDLESQSQMGTLDLQEMLNAQISDQVNLLVYTGGCRKWQNNVISSNTNQIWQVTSKGIVCLEKDLGSVSMTDPNTLAGFIKWCAKKYPANRNGLIFWDHGGGSVSGYGYDEKYASSGSMSLAEIDDALAAGGVKFDFVGFDACLMATTENALMLADHADYMIASEETEPGVGWYYTNWLSALSKNPSMKTTEIGRQIIDDFVETCNKECPGQKTTLSIVDLAELDATVPDALRAFSADTCDRILNNEYQAVSNARSGAREFATSSKIDQVDLVHLASNMGTKEGDALANALLGAVKYNRTSSNMSNSYGLSIYFPFQKASSVDEAVETYEQIGMDDSYARCIQEFANLEISGQVVSGGTTSPLPSLMGTYGGSSSLGTDVMMQLLGTFINGNFGTISGLSANNTGFFNDRAMTTEDVAAYLAAHRFDGSALTWTDTASGAAIVMEEEQWDLVQTLHANMFFDDGEGYIDLGLDTVYDFDEYGNLLAPEECTWIAINEQPVAYYHESTIDDGEDYTITGRVPVLYNGERAELVLEFTDEDPNGDVVGVRTVYTNGETATVPKTMDPVAIGDTLDFVCDYYSYDGEYLDSYLLGDPMIVDGELMISDVYVDAEAANLTFRFTDIYNQEYWSEPVPMS